MGKAIGYKIEGIKNNKCVIVTETGSKHIKVDMGEVCHLEDNLRPLMAKSAQLNVDTINMTIHMMDQGSTLDSKESAEIMIEKMQADQRKIIENSEKLASASQQLVTANGGKNPCTPKDPKSMALLATAFSGMKDNLKDMVLTQQSIKKNSFNRLFPDNKSACIVSTDIKELDNAKRIIGVSNQEECKNLASSTCSDLFNKARLKNLDCPAEINILYGEAEKATGDEILNVPTTVVASVTCEINGMMRANKKMSYDHAFKKQSGSFCKKPKGYSCKLELFSQDKIAIDSKKHHITKRDGAEINCLKLAKKLAAPHCENPNADILAVLTVTAEGHKGISGVLMNEAFKNFCYTHRLKKVFN